MSIIALRNVPATWDLRRLVVSLAKCIKGQFEGLNFANQKGQTKVAYIRLSESLDPTRIIENINKTKFKLTKKQFVRLKAFIPDHIPDLPFAHPQKVPVQTQKRFKIPLEKTLDQVVEDTVTELLVELQSKYTGLSKLSHKTQHKLLTEIAWTIFDRLKQIVTTAESDVCSNGFKLTKAYRKSHPHFADFQLILSTLHRIEDADGTPRTQLLEPELAVVPKEICVAGNIPVDKINITCYKYAEKMVTKIREHIDALKADVCSQPCNQDEVARKRVKEEIIKMSPYIELIVRQVMTTNFVPETLKTGEYLRMRIYGEPYLPPKETLATIMKRHSAVRIMRSDFIYNMLRFNIPRHKYTSIITHDNTTLGSAKLVIRSSEMNTFKLPDGTLAKMKSAIQAL